MSFNCLKIVTLLSVFDIKKVKYNPLNKFFTKALTNFHLHIKTTSNDFDLQLKINDDSTFRIQNGKFFSSLAVCFWN